MKLSERTIKLLNNFANINPSILIEPGKKLKTVSPTQNVFAMAMVEEEFPREVTLYGLPKLLSILSLGESELNFTDNYLEIIQGKSTVKYTYGDPAAIQTAKGIKVAIKNPVVSFELPKEVLSTTIKAMNILRLKEIAFIGRDGKLSIETLSSSNTLSDTFSTHLGETDKEFVAIIENTVLNERFLLPQDYYVTLAGGNSPLSEFKGEECSYWICLSLESTFED